MNPTVRTTFAAVVIAALAHVASAQSAAIEKVEKRVLTIAGERLVATAAEAEAKRLSTAQGPSWINAVR